MQVYCYTFPNGKRYIGQTIHTFTKRAGYKGRRYNTGSIKHAIKKYGWSSIKKEILVENAPSKHYLDLYEKAYISLFHTMDNRFGYNQTSGGDGSIPNEEVRKIISSTKKGKNNPNYGTHKSEEFKEYMRNKFKGRVFTDEWKEKIRQSKLGNKNAMYGKYGELNPNYGNHFKHTEDAKKKISEAGKGRTCYWKGKKMSEETRRKMSESLRKSWKRRKETNNKKQNLQTNLYLDALEDITGCKK